MAILPTVQPRFDTIQRGNSGAPGLFNERMGQVNQTRQIQPVAKTTIPTQQIGTIAPKLGGYTPPQYKIEPWANYSGGYDSWMNRLNTQVKSPIQPITKQVNMFNTQAPQMTQTPNTNYFSNPRRI